MAVRSRWKISLAGSALARLGEIDFLRILHHQISTEKVRDMPISHAYRNDIDGPFLNGIDLDGKAFRLPETLCGPSETEQGVIKSRLTTALPGLGDQGPSSTSPLPNLRRSCARMLSAASKELTYTEIHQ
jgi:hypothetical protein